jgi:hypothetical protein
MTTTTTTGRPLCDRADLLAPMTRRYGEAVLPLCGRAVRFRSLSELEYELFEMERLERDDMGRLVTAQEPMQTTRARLAVLCLCDADGAPLLGEADIEKLSEALDLADSLFLFGKLQEHCGLSGDVEELGARARERAKKNSGTTPANGSP